MRKRKSGKKWILINDQYSIPEDYEPWHYRYVGEAVALEMHEQNLCLEEYVERLKK